MNQPQYKIITVDEIGEHHTQLIEEIVEGWYAEDPIDTHGFLDRLEAWLMQDNQCLPSQLDDPAIKAIMRIARKCKKEISQ